jgi:alpha-methylacyl-CoA racemase
MGAWHEGRGTNLLDTGAHFYDTYETRDGKYVSLGSIEPQFYAELLEKVGLSDEALGGGQMERAKWPELKARFEALFKTKTRDEWCEILEGSDACFAPVLSMTEAPSHPHMAQRGTFVESHGLLQPAPSPRFSRTVAELGRPPAHAGQHTREVLESFGFGADEIEPLVESKTIV